MEPPLAHLSRKLVGAALALIIAAAAPAVRADDNAAAEALFQQAKTLKDAGRWAEACPKVGASYKLDRTLGTLMNLADCEEHIDRIATAWAHWGEAVELSQKAGDKRVDFATKRRDALTKRLPMIRIDVAAGKSTLSVFRDGVRIDPAAYGVPLPSDPGPHVLTVRRGDEALAEKKVLAKEADTTVATFDLVAIEKAAPPPPPPPGASTAQRTAGWVVGGVGLATFLTAGVLEMVAINAKAEATDPGACVKNYCTTTGLDAIERARSFANAGQWVGIGGILVAAVGVTLVLTSSSGRATPARPTTSLSVAPWAGPGTAGLSLGGLW